jgi:hypothetical protein
VCPPPSSSPDKATEKKTSSNALTIIQDPTLFKTTVIALTTIEEAMGSESPSVSSRKMPPFAEPELIGSLPSSPLPVTKSSSPLKIALATNNNMKDFKVPVMTVVYSPTTAVSQPTTFIFPATEDRGEEKTVVMSDPPINMAVQLSPETHRPFSSISTDSVDSPPRTVSFDVVEAVEPQPVKPKVKLTKQNIKDVSPIVTELDPLSPPSPVRVLGDSQKPRTIANTRSSTATSQTVYAQEPPVDQTLPTPIDPVCARVSK